MDLILRPQSRTRGKVSYQSRNVKGKIKGVLSIDCGESSTPFSCGSHTTKSSSQKMARSREPVWKKVCACVWREVLKTQSQTREIGKEECLRGG